MFDDNDTPTPEQLRQLADELEEEDSDDGDGVPDELERMLNWADVTVSPDSVDGDYIAAWDDSHNLQSRNVKSERFDVGYIQWGDSAEYEDSFIEVTIEDTEAVDD